MWPRRATGAKLGPNSIPEDIRMKTRTIFTLVGAIFGVALSSSAHAQEFTKGSWPLAIVERPILIPQGMLEIRGDTLRMNLSDGSAGDPIQLAPDFYYGIGKNLNIGIVHRDSGICLAGDACAKSYNDVGIDALLGFMNRGTLLLAFRGGIRIPSFDNLVSGLNAGLVTQLGAGKIRIDFSPTLYLGVIGRSADNPGDAALKETISAPLHVWYQAQPQTAVFLRTGLEGPLSGFGDSFQVPIGLGAMFSVNNRLDVGGELVFSNLAGKGASADARWLVGHLNIRL